MDDVFIPLLPTGCPPSQKPVDTRLKVRPAKEFAQPHPTSSPGSRTSGHGCSGAVTPIITFRREGERITQIRIECPCGQTVALDCEY
jgi:hypothetical protein